MSGDASLNQTGNYFIIGTNNTGNFNQTGGSVNSTVDRGFFISDGGGTSSSLTVSGGNFNLAHNGSYDTDLRNTWIGRGGQNDSVMVNGGNFSVNNTASGPSGRRFYLTRDGSFAVNSGTANISNMQYVIVGRSRGAGTSQFTIDGGVTSVGVNTAFVVGGGVDGAFTINNGTIGISRVEGAGGNLWINDAGTTNSASVTLTTGLLNVEGEVLLGRDSSGTASFTMTGGELRAASLAVGSNPSALFEFLDGDIFLEGSQLTVIDEPWFDGTPGTTANFDSSTGLTHIFVIPEPSSLLLLGLATITFGIRRRR